METSLLKILGQVAGVGGIALGVLLLVFRDVIRRRIFPKLAKAQAYKIIRLVIVLTFSIAVVGIAAWVFISTQSRYVAPSKEVARWSKNWQTINESVPWMGSSQGYSATNRERLLDQLRALELPPSSNLVTVREDLISMVRGAQARPEDPTYNMLVPTGFSEKYKMLKRAIRDRAIELGVNLVHQ